MLHELPLNNNNDFLLHPFSYYNIYKLLVQKCDFYRIFLKIFSIISGLVNCQTGHVTSDGLVYICVLPGTCQTNGGGTGIDPRIVTPVSQILQYFW